MTSLNEEELLKPQKILDDYSNQLLNKDSAIDQLVTLIESSNHHKIRLESIKILGMLSVVNNRIFSLLENLLISDKDENVRISAAKILNRDYYEKSLEPMKWALSHDNSPDSLKIILKTLIKIINHLLNTGSRDIIEKEIKSMNHEEFKIGFEILREEYPINGLKNQEFADILINSFILTYLEKMILGVKYKLKECKITQLDFQFKGLDEIPEAIKYLRDLKELDLSYNQIKVIPTWIGNLSQLEVLKLDSNNLSIIPSSIGELKSLKYLSFRRNNLSELPEEIGAFDLLEILILNENHLKEIPEIIGNLSRLKKLILYGNELKELPESISKLKDLESLDLSFNRLRTLPEEIGLLRSLKRLNCEQNRLIQIPSSIKELNKLKYLNISRNELKELTNSLRSLKSLEEIYLGDNKLSKLPKLLKKLESRGVQVYHLRYSSPSHYKHLIRDRNKKYTYYPSLRY